jgi:antitoxin component YwqK of YwqJK toxin-antitoxin module
MKKFTLLLSLFILFFINSCDSAPSLSSKKVKKEYFTGGQIRTEFIMDDDTGQNGLLKKYGYNGNVTSTVTIRNGVKHGTETGFDTKGRLLWKQNFVNGKQDGQQYAYYPNGDVMVSYTYVNGIKEGPAQTYNKDGSVHKRVLYKHDKIIN